MSDVAEFYQDRTFPGRKLIAVGLAPIALYWIAGALGMRFSEAQPPVPIITSSILLIGAIIYLIGYWKAVKGKGYPGLIWLASLTGPIGLIVILFLPDLKKNEKKGA